MAELMSRVITVSGRKTCMRLTDIEWRILERICRKEKIRRRVLLDMIECNRKEIFGLTPSVRLFTLVYVCYRLKAMLERGATSSETSEDASFLQKVLQIIR